MPDSNSLSLNGTQNYVLVYDMRTDVILRRSLAHTCELSGSKHKNDNILCACITLNKMYGQTMEVLQQKIGDDILTHLQRQFYTVKCEKDGKYYVNITSTIQGYLRQNELHNAVRATLFLANNVNIQEEYAKYLISIIVNSGDTLQNTKLHKNDTQRLFNDDVRYIDSLTQLNSTYVNIVNDCNYICVQGATSGAYRFMSAHILERYGSYCAKQLTHRSDHDYDTTTHSAQVVHDDNSNIYALCALIFIPLIAYLIYILRVNKEKISAYPYMIATACRYAIRAQRHARTMETIVLNEPELYVRRNNYVDKHDTTDNSINDAVVVVHVSADSADND